MKLMWIALAAGAAIATGASASTVIAKYDNVLYSRGGTFTVQLDRNGGPVIGPSNVGAGGLQHTFRNDSQRFANQTLTTFCVDLGQNVAGSYSTYNVGTVAGAPVPASPAGLIGATRAGYLQSLYSNAVGAGLIDMRGSVITSAMSTHQATAFQLVVWELAFEDEGNLLTTEMNGYSLASVFGGGEFTVAGNTTSNTNWLNSLGADAIFDQFFGWAFAGDSFGRLAAMTSGVRQDQLIIIPLPTGGALALAGLAGIAIRRRR